MAYLQAHLDAFVAREIDVPLQGLTAEIETLRTNFAEVDNTVVTLEEAKAQWAREANGVVPEHAAILQARMFELRAEQSAAVVAGRVAQSELRLAKKLLNSEDPKLEVFVDEATPFADRIAVVRRELAGAVAQGKGPMHPDVVTGEAELARLEGVRDDVLANGATRIAKHKNPAYAALRKRVEEAKTVVHNAGIERARVDADLRAAEAAVAVLPARDAEYAELSREIGVATALHGELSAKLKASEMRLRLEERHAHARYDLLQPPYAEPASRTKALVTRGSIGAALGLMLIVMAALLREVSRSVAARVGPAGL